MDYDKGYFMSYVFKVASEMFSRNINYNDKFYWEIVKFCSNEDIEDDSIKSADEINYPEHDERYLRQCYYNLEEKADRGIILPDEWQKIYNYCKEEGLI